MPGGVGGVPARLGNAPTASAVKPLKVAVVACMDPRLRLEAALGVGAGQAVFIRNAGGIITEETLYSLRAAYDVFGAREFAIVGHDDCAFARDGAEQWDGTGVEAVRSQVQKLRLWSGLPRDVTLRGFVYTLARGRVTEVDPVGGAAPAPPQPGQLPALLSGQNTPPAVSRLQTSAKPAAVASQAETKRVGGRLHRQRLDRIPPAEPSMPRSSSNPTRDDFRRKVESMEAGEAAALNTLDIAGNAGEAPAKASLTLTARDFVRALIVSEALKGPRQRSRPES